eukprot:GHVU01147213.1.p1 GENE.GHVU01147213.1~~GHVU01147213.1.p1  ORF type:complete len:533 (-),score=143.50 GHVU01147213.1:254-1852(-)
MAITDTLEKSESKLYQQAKEYRATAKEATRTIGGLFRKVDVQRDTLRKNMDIAEDTSTTVQGRLATVTAQLEGTKAEHEAHLSQMSECLAERLEGDTRRHVEDVATHLLEKAKQDKERYRKLCEQQAAGFALVRGHLSATSQSVLAAERATRERATNTYQRKKRKLEETESSLEALSTEATTQRAGVDAALRAASDGCGAAVDAYRAQVDSVRQRLRGAGGEALNEVEALREAVNSSIEKSKQALRARTGAIGEKVKAMLDEFVSEAFADIEERHGQLLSHVALAETRLRSLEETAATVTVAAEAASGRVLEASSKGAETIASSAEKLEGACRATAGRAAAGVRAAEEEDAAALREVEETSTAFERDYEGRAREVDEASRRTAEELAVYAAALQETDLQQTQQAATTLQRLATADISQLSAELRERAAAIGQCASSLIANSRDELSNALADVEGFRDNFVPVPHGGTPNRWDAFRLPDESPSRASPVEVMRKRRMLGEPLAATEKAPEAPTGGEGGGTPGSGGEGGATGSGA